MTSARMRLAMLVGSLLPGSLMPIALFGQEHKHQPAAPIGKPETKQPQLALADLEQLALEHNPTLMQDEYNIKVVNSVQPLRMTLDLSI